MLGIFGTVRVVRLAKLCCYNDNFSRTAKQHGHLTRRLFSAMPSEHFANFPSRYATGYGNGEKQIFRDFSHIFLCARCVFANNKLVKFYAIVMFFDQQRDVKTKILTARPEKRGREFLNSLANTERTVSTLSQNTCWFLFLCFILLHTKQ